MSDAQHTSLLDEYLQKTGACQVANPNRDRQQLETLVLDDGDDALPHSSQAATIAGNMMLKDVHQALDDVLAAATGSPASAAGRQTSAATIQRSRSTARTATQQQAGLTSSTALGSTANGTPGKQCGSGIFRAMRQADAAALYAQRFKRDQEDRGQQQQPLLVAPDDGTNGAVRAIASNAALQAKLAKLQADMEARSYRQELLEQMQRPGTLFQQQQQQVQRRQHHHHGHSNSMDPYAAHASGQPTDTTVFQGLSGRYGTLRPATSPALMGEFGLTTDPTAAFSSAATAASSRRSSVANTDRVVQSRHTTGTGSLPGTPGKLAAAQQQQQQQRLKHLQELADYELPWKPAVAPAAPGRAANGRDKAGDVYSSHVMASQQARPWTSAGAAAAEPQRHSTSSGGSIGISSNRLQGLAATPRRHSTLGGSSMTADLHRHQQQQQQKQSQQQHVQRPASAVAALQQSLSELAVFKSRVQQHQQEQKQEQHACIEQPPLSQQHHHSWRQTDPVRGCGVSGSRVAQQRPHSSTWLQEHSLQHLHEPPTQHGPVDYGLLQGQAASAGGGYVDGHCSRQRAGDNRRRSSSAGYGLWDSWQEHVHNPAAAAAADARHGYRSSSYGGSFGHSSMQRAQSVPRPRRAWDVLPLPSVAAGAASMRARRRSCSVSSPGKLTGHLQQLRQQQEQRRPLTAGGALGGGMHTARDSSTVRPLGLHNSHVAYGAASGAAAAAAAAAGVTGSISRSNASSSSAWLVSSPLKRAQQLVATGGRPRSSSGGGSSAAAAGSLGGAANRAKTVAAVLSGVQAPEAAAQARNFSIGGSLGNADSRRQSRLGARTSAPGSSAAAAQLGAGKASAVTAQLLQQVRAQQASSGGARISCSGISCADKVAAAAARMRSSGGGSSSAAGSAPLTAQILEYAAGLYKPLRAKPRPLDSCSTSSTGSSDTSDSSSLAPAMRDKQAAYAAALARVRAAKQASGRDDSDYDTS